MKTIRMKQVSHVEYYEWEREQKEAYHNFIHRKIEKSGNELFNKMLSIVNRKVKHYKSDFYVHDFNTLTSSGGQFVWLVRQNGTHLYSLSNDFKMESDAAENDYNAVMSMERVLYVYLIDVDNQTIKKIKDKPEFSYTYNDQYEYLKKLGLSIENEIKVMQLFKKESLQSRGYLSLDQCNEIIKECTK